MKPELKLGRPVIAGDTEPLIAKGKYLYPALSGREGHYVLLDGNQADCWYKHVKPDLTAEPMNGDEVEVSDDKKHWYPPRLYVGKTKDGRHFTGGDFNCDVSSWNHVRFPQQSKRERIRAVLEKGYAPVDTDDLVNEILKIWGVEES